MIGQALRRHIVGEIQATFNDEARGQSPVTRRPQESLFGPHSPVWRVHDDVTSMTVGAVAALLMQMLHPAVLAGVWDHSRFREDMLGRLRRTARFIALTTYGSRSEAEAMIARVRQIHARIKGYLPDGTPYAADDPRLLAWVHVAETTSFLDAWIRYAAPTMSAIDQDHYFRDMAQVAEALGADPVPTSRAEARALIEAMRPELRADARTRDVARIVLHQPARTLATAPAQAFAIQAAVDLLPDWARALHGLHPPMLPRPLIRAATLGIAGTVRWAFRS